MKKQKLDTTRSAHKGLCVFCKDPIELFENVCYSWDDEYQSYGLHEACKIQVQIKLQEKLS